MADVNIKEVEGGEVTTLSDADGVEIDTGTNSVWIKVSNLVQAILKRINDLTAKTTLADADNFTLTDSAASHAAKKITWANVMAAILAYTGTFTNKRITQRITTITSNATPTINTDDCDAVTITALAAAITSMTTNLSGTPTNFQKLIIRIKDDGTARAITWGASFEAKGVALPTTTVISKVLTVGFIYDTVTSKWGCVASAQET